METQAQTPFAVGPKTPRRGWILGGLAVASTVVMAAFASALGKSNLALDRAIGEQERLASEQPAKASVFNDLGNLLVLAGRLSEAETAYRRALELEPNAAGTHFNLGLLYASRGERRAALREFRRTLELDPGNAWAHYEKGKIYLAWGLKRLAERAFAHAFRLDPRLADSRYNPHVLENPLATRALLQSHRLPGQDIQAPMAYEEGGRIARLLLTRSPSPSASEVGFEPEEVPPAVEGFRSGSSLEPPPPDGAREDPPILAKEETVATEPRKLTADDLPSDPSNQIRGGKARGGVLSERLQSKWEAMEPWRVPKADAPPPPAPEEEPPPFETALDSTGRLEFRLEAAPRLARLGPVW